MEETREKQAVKAIYFSIIGNFLLALLNIWQVILEILMH